MSDDPISAFSTCNNPVMEKSVQSSRSIPLGENVSALDLCCPHETDAGPTWQCNTNASVDKWTDGMG